MVFQNCYKYLVLNQMQKLQYIYYIFFNILKYMEKQPHIELRIIYSHAQQLYILLQKMIHNIKQSQKPGFIPIQQYGYFIILKPQSKLLFLMSNSKLLLYGFSYYEFERSKIQVLLQSTDKLIIKQKGQSNSFTIHEIQRYNYEEFFQESSLFLVLCNFLEKTIKQQKVSELKQQIKQSKNLSRKNNKERKIVKIQFDEFSYLIFSPITIKYVQDKITIWEYTIIRDNSKKMLNRLVSFSKDYHKSVSNSLQSKISEASIKNKRSISTVAFQNPIKRLNSETQLKIRQQSLPTIYKKRSELSFKHNKLQLKKPSTPTKRTFTEANQHNNSNVHLDLQNKLRTKSNILKLNTQQTNVPAQNSFWTQNSKNITLTLNTTKRKKLQIDTKCMKKSYLPAVRPKLSLTNNQKCRKQLHPQAKHTIEKYCHNASKMLTKSYKLTFHGLSQLEKEASIICCQSYCSTNSTIRQKRSIQTKFIQYSYNKGLLSTKKPLYRSKQQQETLNQIYKLFDNLLTNLQRSGMSLQSNPEIQETKPGLTTNLKKINSCLRQAKLFEMNRQATQKQKAINQIFQIFSNDLPKNKHFVSIENYLYMFEKDKYVLEDFLKKLTSLLQEPMQKEPDKAEKLISYLSIFAMQTASQSKFKGNHEEALRTIKLKNKDTNFLMPIGIFARKFKDNIIAHFKKFFNNHEKMVQIQINDFSQAVETIKEKILVVQEKCTNILLYLNKVILPCIRFTTEQINELEQIFTNETVKYNSIELTEEFKRYQSINQHSLTQKNFPNLVEATNCINTLQQNFHLVNAAPNLIAIFNDKQYKNFYLNVRSAKKKLMDNIFQHAEDIYKQYETDYSIKKSQLNKRMRFITPKNSIQAIQNFQQCNHKDSNYDEVQTFYRQLCQLTHFLTDRSFTGLTEDQKNNNYIFQMYQSAYEIKKDIQGFLDNYEKIMTINLSNYHQVIESLQKEYQQSKQHLRNLTIRLKILMKKIKNKHDIFDLQDQIRKLEAEYQKYLQNNQRLKQEMESYQMICWQEQQYFKNNIVMLMEVLNFFSMKEAKKIYNNTIHYLTFQQYKIFTNNYSIFIQKLQQHQFYDLFIKDFEQFTKASPLVEIFLTKCFTGPQKNKILELGYDINSTSSMRIYNILNLNETISETNYQKLKKLYIQSKENQFKKLKNLSIQRIQLIFEQIKFVGNDGNQIPRSLKKLSNELQILKTIDDYFGDKEKDIQFIARIIKFFKRVYTELYYMKKMIEYNPLLQEKKRTFYEFLDIYENIIEDTKYIGKKIVSLENQQVQLQNNLLKIKSTTSKQLKSVTEQLICNFQEFQKKLVRYKESQILPYCLDRIRSFHRLCLMSYSQLIQSYDWSTPQQIKMNIINMYNQVTDVEIETVSEPNSCIDLQIQKQNSSQSQQSKNVVLVTKLMLGYQDTISFPQPINITKLLKNNSDILKFISINVQNFLQNTISSSLHRTSQIKLISWFTYFTQQVQYHILMNISLAQLTTKIVETQQQINNNLRYDVSHHIMCQITQLGLFRDHLRIFKQFPSQNDFEWISTIKMNEKNKRIIVEQYKNDFVYNFEPKRSIVIHPRMKILVSPNYGDKKLMQQFKISSYILGKPYCHFQHFDEMFLCAKPTRIVELIQRYQFFISINVDKQNIDLIDNLHKSIFKNSLQHLQIFNSSSSNQRSLKIPIFLNYQDNKIPGLLSHFRNRQNNYLVVNLQLLVITKLEKYCFEFKSSNEALSNWIKHFPTKIVKLFKAIIEVLSIGKEKILATLSDIETNFEQLIIKLTQNEKKYSKFKNSLQPEIRQNLASFRELITQIISHNILEKKQTIKYLVEQTLKNYEQVRVSQQSQDYIERFIDQWVSEISIKGNSQNAYLVDKAKIENNIILYGPVSGKTHIITKIINKYQKQQIYCCGAAKYVELIHLKNIKKKLKIIVETQSLGFIPPNIIVKENLLYLAQKTSDEASNIFMDMISLMKKRNQSKAQLFIPLNNCEFNPIQVMNKAFTSQVEQLCLQFFQAHFLAFESNQKETFQPKSSKKLALIQNTIRPFEERITKINKRQVLKEHILTIFNQTIFQICYYTLEYLDRRKYIQILKNQFSKRKISQILTIKIQDLTIYTIKQGEVVKIQSMIGRKRPDIDIFDTDFIHMIKNISVQEYYISSYKALGISSFVRCQSYPYRILFNKIKAKIAQQQLYIHSTNQKIQQIFGSITSACCQLSDSSSKILCEKRNQFYSGYSIVFIDDIHLASHDKMDLLINHLEKFAYKQFGKMLICSGSFQKLNYYRLYRHFLRIILPPIQFENIFRTFTKVGISEQLIDTMKKIVNSNEVLQNELAKYKFLFKVCLKLPTQFYKKFFINQLILSKLTIEGGNTAAQVQKIFTQLDSVYSNTNKQFYIRRRKGQLNEIVHKEFYFQVDKLINHFCSSDNIMQICYSYFPSQPKIRSGTTLNLLNIRKLEQMFIAFPLNEHLNRNYYIEILRFCVADCHYIIRQDFSLLPQLMAKLQGYNLYHLNANNFEKDLVSIIKQLNTEDTQSGINNKNQHKIKSAKISTKKNYALVTVPSELIQDEKFQRLLQCCVNKYSIVSFFQEIFKYYNEQKQCKEYVSNCLQQAKKIRTNIDHTLWYRIKFIITLNFTQKFIKWQSQEINQHFVQIDARFPQQDKIKAVDEYLSLFIQKIKMIKKAYESEFKITFQAKSTNINEKCFEEFQSYCNTLKYFMHKILTQRSFPFMDVIKSLKKIIMFMEEKISEFVNFTMALKSSHSKDIHSQFSLQDDEIIEQTQKFIGQASFVNFSSINILSYKNYTDYFNKINEQIQIKRVEYLLIKILRDNNMNTLSELRNKIMKYQFQKANKLIDIPNSIKKSDENFYDKQTITYKEDKLIIEIQQLNKKVIEYRKAYLELQNQNNILDPVQMVKQFLEQEQTEKYNLQTQAKQFLNSEFGAFFEKRQNSIIIKKCDSSLMKLIAEDPLHIVSGLIDKCKQSQNQKLDLLYPYLQHILEISNLLKFEQNQQTEYALQKQAQLFDYHYTLDLISKIRQIVQHLNKQLDMRQHHLKYYQQIYNLYEFFFKSKQKKLVQQYIEGIYYRIIQYFVNNLKNTSEQEFSLQQQQKLIIQLNQLFQIDNKLRKNFFRKDYQDIQVSHFRKSKVNVLAKDNIFAIYDPYFMFKDLYDHRTNKIVYELCIMTDNDLNNLGTSRVNQYASKPIIYCFCIFDLHKLDKIKIAIQYCLNKIKQKNRDLTQYKEKMEKIFEIEKIALILGKKQYQRYFSKWVDITINFEITYHYFFEDIIMKNAKVNSMTNELQQFVLKYKICEKRCIKIFEDIHQTPQSELIEYFQAFKWQITEFLKYKGILDDCLEELRLARKEHPAPMVLKAYKALKEKLKQGGIFYKFLRRKINTHQNINTNLTTSKLLTTTKFLRGKPTNHQQDKHIQNIFLSHSQNLSESKSSINSSSSIINSEGTVSSQLLKILDRIKSGYTIYTLDELKECLTLSNLVCVIYNRFNSKLMKDLHLMEQQGLIDPVYAYETSSLERLQIEQLMDFVGEGVDFKQADQQRKITKKVKIFFVQATLFSEQSNMKQKDIEKICQLVELGEILQI